MQTPNPPLSQPSSQGSTSDPTWGSGRLHEVLSLYTGRPGSTFTSQQQENLLRAVLEGKAETIIAILPTGSGKSAAIFGPPLAESEGVTVVVTCYTALRRQLAQQAASYGIRHLVWNKRNEPDSPNPASVRLVIMITDDLSTADALQLVPSILLFCPPYAYLGPV